MEERVSIDVLFSEKDEVKKLGAKWDQRHKSWYIPSGINQDIFKKWWHKNSNNIKYGANYFFLAQNTRCCWKCNEYTNVYAIFLNNFREKETFNSEDNTPSYQWYLFDWYMYASDICYINAEAFSEIQKITRCFHFDHSQTINSSYLMNHCENCNAKLGDWFLFNDASSPFFPQDYEDCQKIKLLRFNTKITLDCGYSIQLLSIDFYNIPAVDI